METTELTADQVRICLEAFTRLPMRQRQVLAMRYRINISGIDSIKFGRFYTFEEVGEVFKLTKQRAQQLENEAIKNIVLYTKELA